MENLYDSFARALAPYLTGLLQSFCEININGIVEKRYQEFSSSVQDHSLFGMITMSPANKDYNEAPLTMEVDTRLAFFMIERLLGGAGTEYELTRDFTDIEKAVLQYVLGKLTEFAGEAWAQYLDSFVQNMKIQRERMSVMALETVHELFDFIENSPSCFHVIDNVKAELKKEGFEELCENKKCRHALRAL